jgi:uncharacterized protein (UPF0332 family)
MDDDELKANEINSYLNMAQEYLDIAKTSLKEDKFRVAVDTAYNSSEACVRALLHLKLEGIPRSHGGLNNKFDELYVVTGIVPKKMGRDLNIMMELRSQARYDAHALVRKEDALSAIELAETLMELLKNLME